MDTQDTNKDVHNPGFVAPTSSTMQPELELAELPGSPSEHGPVSFDPTDKSTRTQSNKKSLSPLQESLQRFRRDIRAMISLTIIILLTLISIFGPFLYQHAGAPIKSNISGKLVGSEVYRTFDHQENDRQDQPPSAAYWMGTDSIGRDIFARLMQGILISIVLAILVEVVNIVLGITFGVLAGYYGGFLDQVLARIADIMFAFPGLLFLIMLTGILGQWADTTLDGIPIIGPNGNARLLLISMGLAFTSWPLMARYVRGQTLQLKEQQFIEAARTSGATNGQIILKHIVPNLFSIVLTASTLNISGTIIGEAGISFLGLGVRPPGSSLGLMVSDGARAATVYPWQALFPAFTLIIIVLSFSFIGDGLRDAFDPRSKD